MTETDMSKLDYADVGGQLDDYKVSPATTDAASGQKETEWINRNWSQQFGYYQKIPELKAAINAKATWTVGKGFTADEATTMLLDTIRGFGKDTFNTIIENMVRTYHIGGDSFAEIIESTVKEDDVMINLKTLDPSTMKVVANKEGKIIRYEQVSKTKNPNKKFKPEEIFHLSKDRVADEIHGTSVIDAVKEIILMRNEAMADWKRVLHRNIDPLFIFHLDTDDTTKIAAVKAKFDEARGKGENLYVPKGAVVPELVSTATNSTLSPLSWIESLNDYFYEAVGVPKIIIGGSKAFTEASAKISYLAFQQTIEEEQLYIEEQALYQLNIVIKLTFPASLENEMLSNKPKEGEEVNSPEIQAETAVEPNDQMIEMEGRK